jgi:hypothetical protein
VLCQLDSVFAAATQIEYNAALVSTAETQIKSIEDELLRLKEIAAHSQATESSWTALFKGSKSATDERVRYLLNKMGKAVDALGALEKENAECKTKLAVGK